MKVLCFSIAFWALAIQVWAQAPTSNLFMFDMSRQADGSFQFAQPRFLTNFNALGYNNHPHFVSGDEILFSSQQPGESQPDVVRISLRDSSLTYLTRTQEGEYSPKTSAMDYGQTYYAVRMEFTGRDTLLRLWRIPFDARIAQFPSGARPVFQDQINVGYYEIGPSNQAALHLNAVGTTPNTLALAPLTGGLITPVATNVGRCFRFNAFPAQLIFLQRRPGQGDMLMSLDVAFGRAGSGQAAKSLIAPKTGSQDFTVLQDGTLLMASGSRLFKFKPGSDDDWVPIADFSSYQLTKITRLEVNRENNRIILVN